MPKSERLGTVPLDHPMVPDADIHRWAVVDGDPPEVVTVRRGNGMVEALTYRTRLHIHRAVDMFGGRVLDRQDGPDG